MITNKDIGIVYLAAAIGYGSIAAEFDKAKCAEYAPITYVLIGVIWPLVTMVTVGVQLFDIKMPPNKCPK